MGWGGGKERLTRTRTRIGLLKIDFLTQADGWGVESLKMRLDGPGDGKDIVVVGKGEGNLIPRFEKKD